MTYQTSSLGAPLGPHCHGQKGVPQLGTPATGMVPFTQTRWGSLTHSEEKLSKSHPLALGGTEPLLLVRAWTTGWCHVLGTNTHPSCQSFKPLWISMHTRILDWRESERRKTVPVLSKDRRKLGIPSDLLILSVFPYFWIKFNLVSFVKWAFCLLSHHLLFLLPTKYERLVLSGWNHTRALCKDIYIFLINTGSSQPPTSKTIHVAWKSALSYLYVNQPS